MDDISGSGARMRATYPSLDTEPLAVSDRVIRLARHLAISRREVLARRELQVWEYEVLLALRTAKSDDGLSPGALMAATQVASATMTNRVDRLATRSFVSREPDPADRRGVLVRLSPSGRRRIDRAVAEVAEAEGALWAAVASRDRQRLTALLREILPVIES